MASSAGLGGLPILPSTTPVPQHAVPLSTHMLAQAEYAKRYEDLIANQQGHINHLDASLKAATAAAQAAHTEVEARDEDIGKWVTFAAGLGKDVETGENREAELVGDKQLLQEKFGRLEEETQPLREEKDTVVKQLAGALAMINDLQTQKDELKAQVAKQEQEAAMVGRLHAFKLRECNDEREEANKRFQQEKQTLADKLTTADADVVRLQEALKVKRIATAALLSEKNDLSEKLADALALARARLKSLEEAEEAVKQLQSTKAKAERDLATTTTTVTKLQGDLDETKRTLSTATEYNKVLQRNVDAVSTQTTQAQADNVKLKSANDQLTTDKAAVEQKLVDAKSALKQSLAADEQLKTAAVESDKAKTDLVTQIEANTKADTKLRAQYQHCLRDNNELHALRTKSAEALATEQGLTAGLRDTVASLQQQVGGLRTTIERLEADIQREKHTADTATAMVLRRQAENADFLRSTTAPPTPLKAITVLSHTETNGQVKHGEADTSLGAAPTTPELNDQRRRPRLSSTTSCHRRRRR